MDAGTEELRVKLNGKMKRCSTFNEAKDMTVAKAWFPIGTDVIVGAKQ